LLQIILTKVRIQILNCKIIFRNQASKFHQPGIKAAFSRLFAYL
jgi:hypothetical protein